MTKTAETFPVVEIFGPTIQGEGFLAGLPTLFVRFGLCDFRCSWCDSMYAVDPVAVKLNATSMRSVEIVESCLALVEGDPGGMYVTLSGGNPAIHDLGLLTRLLHEQGFLVSVETQGSFWRDWLVKVDHLTISPKPPSSGMVTERHDHQWATFFEQASKPTRLRHTWASLKVVVFDDADLEWARWKIRQVPCNWPTFLSVGTVQPDDVDLALPDRAEVDHDAALGQISGSYRWLCEQVAGDPDFRKTRVLPQLHVVAWGHARAV